MASPAPTVDRTFLAGRAAASAVSRDEEGAVRPERHHYQRDAVRDERAGGGHDSADGSGRPTSASSSARLGLTACSVAPLSSAAASGAPEVSSTTRAPRAARSATSVAQARLGHGVRQRAGEDHRPAGGDVGERRPHRFERFLRHGQARQVDVGRFAGRPVGDLDVGPGLARDAHEAVGYALAGEEVGEGAVVGMAEHAGRGDARAPVGEAAGDVDPLAAAVEDGGEARWTCPTTRRSSATVRSIAGLSVTVTTSGAAARS